MITYLMTGTIDGAAVAKVGRTHIDPKYRLDLIRHFNMPDAQLVATRPVREHFMLAHFREHFDLHHGREWFAASPAEAAECFASCDPEVIRGRIDGWHRSGLWLRSIARHTGIAMHELGRLVLPSSPRSFQTRVIEGADCGWLPGGIASCLGVSESSVREVFAAVDVPGILAERRALVPLGRAAA